jgi:hypothetical protein
MSLPFVITTFFVITIPVATVSFFINIKKTLQGNVALSDVKKYSPIFHTYSSNYNYQSTIQYKEIDCNLEFVDIWSDDAYG